MISLIFQQQYALFVLIIIALIISLTFHEYGHGIVAKWFGDDTAEQAGRLTLNPAAHIDPFGLMMVILIGFGYAKPVPTNPANYRSRWAILLVAAAGPAMNLLVAVISINLYIAGLVAGIEFLQGSGPEFFFHLPGIDQYAVNALQPATHWAAGWPLYSALLSTPKPRHPIFAIQPSIRCLCSFRLNRA